MKTEDFALTSLSRKRPQPYLPSTLNANATINTREAKEPYCLIAGPDPPHIVVEKSSTKSVLRPWNPAS